MSAEFANRITIQASVSPGMGFEEVFNQAVAVSARLACWLDLDCGACRVLVNSRMDFALFNAQYTVGCERRAKEDSEKLLAAVRAADAERAAPIAERVYLALQDVDLETNGEAGTLLNTFAPNVTVCPACFVDDFVHVEGCRLSPNVQKSGTNKATSTGRARSKKSTHETHT